MMDIRCRYCGYGKVPLQLSITGSTGELDGGFRQCSLEGTCPQCQVRLRFEERSVHPIYGRYFDQAIQAQQMGLQAVATFYQEAFDACRV